MKIIKVVIIACLAFSLTHCAHTKVQQGNLLPDHAIVRLKPGMTKDEVAAILGTSLLTNTFENNRWDYAYTLRVGNGPMTMKHLVIYFTNDRLSSMSANS